MSNLTDLLPAGAGSKQVSFVASGTIGNGVTVGLNSDGTVSAVSSTGASPSAGTPEVFYSGIIYENDIAYEPVNNVLCIV